MTGIELMPFDAEHVDAAATLLAERHARHRRVEPLLPERFEDPAAARVELEALRRADGASGVIALAGDALVGYLLGVPRADVETWGPNVWVEPAGHATAEPELVRDLYAAAAARWVDAGLTRHYALVPSEPALVSAWFRVGFGQQHASGIQETGTRAGATTPAGSAVVREASESDVEDLLELAPLLNEHQARAPVFSGRPPLEPEEELRAEFLADLADPSIGTFVAEIGGMVVSSFVACPVELSSTHTGLLRPPGAALLAWAASRPERRGAGAGLALTDACLTWAAEQGHGVMVTDWRVTNLLASRFWPRRGFRETFLRLYRSIP
jgi:ribosomal protein S18 acetylase RimI-like enzyme